MILIAHVEIRVHYALRVSCKIKENYQLSDLPAHIVSDCPSPTTYSHTHTHIYSYAYTSFFTITS